LEAIAQNHGQILISNTSVESLELFLNAVQVKGYFVEAFAANNHRSNGSSKKEILAAYLKGKSFESIVVIDDSPSAAELLSVAGGVFYLYTHPHLPFKESKADYKIRDLREILREV
jgi:hypothetical protein